MRAAVLGLIGAALLCGCVSVQKFDVPPQTLRDQIRSGELAQPGDRVSIVTATTGERVFVVTEVDQDVIRGEGVEIPIDDVVAVTKLGLDVPKTALAVGGGVRWVLRADLDGVPHCRRYIVDIAPVDP